VQIFYRDIRRSFIKVLSGLTISTKDWRRSYAKTDFHLFQKLSDLL